MHNFFLKSESVTCYTCSAWDKLFSSPMTQKGQVGNKLLIRNINAPDIVYSWCVMSNEVCGTFIACYRHTCTGDEKWLTKKQA